MARSIVKQFTIIAPDDAKHRIAQTHSTFDDCVKDWLNIRRRSTDEVEQRCLLYPQKWTLRSGRDQLLTRSRKRSWDSITDNSSCARFNPARPLLGLPL